MRCRLNFMNKSIFIFLVVFIVGFTFSKSQSIESNRVTRKNSTHNKDSLIKVADSLMNIRITYFSEQFGSIQKMEAFYGKSVDSIKNEFREIFLDSLMKNNE